MNAADSFHTKKLCGRLSSSAILDGSRPFCVLSTPLGSLRVTYDDHLN